MACYRCSTCGHSYPRMVEFKRCEVCEQGCDPLADPPTMTTKQARSHFRHGEFERRWARDQWDDPDKRHRVEREGAARALAHADQVLALERNYRMESA